MPLPTTLTRRLATVIMVAVAFVLLSVCPVAADATLLFSPQDDIAAIIGSWNLSQSAEAQDNSDAVFDREPAQVAKVEAAWERMFKREVRQDYAAGMRLPPVFPEEDGSWPAAADRSRNPRPAPSAPQAPANGPAQVWVNTRSGKYFLPGSRYYGKTKEGAYLSAEACGRRATSPPSEPPPPSPSSSQGELAPFLPKPAAWNRSPFPLPCHVHGE